MSKPVRTKKRKQSQLKIVLDSNAIHNSSASYLLTHEVYQLVRDSANYSDLAVTWYLPDIVRHERQFQMQKQGLALIQHVQKLETLLGHNLNITQEIIVQRVQEAIDRQITELGISLLAVDSNKVDWEGIMLDAVYRRPPFSTGESEKGFRDALICQVFAQLVSTSAATPSVCRIALVTADNLLAEAARAQTTGRLNVRIVPTIEELKGLINTLVSEVSEQYVEEIKAEASTYFFQREGKDSLYYKEDVWQKLVHEFNDQLYSLPEGANEREHEKTSIGKPRFVRKERQRVFWVNQITVLVKAYKRDQIDLSSPLLGGGSVAKAGEAPAFFVPPGIGPQRPYQFVIPDKLAGPYWQVPGKIESESLVSGASALATTSLQAYMPTKRLVKSGKITFEITWSVTVSATKGLFSRPRIESLEHVETVWE